MTGCSQSVVGMHAKVRDRLRLLEGQSPDAICRVLLPTVPHLKIDEVESVCTLLLSLDRTDADLAIISQLHRWRERGFAVLHQSQRDLWPALARASQHDDVTIRKSALTFLEETTELRYAPLCVPHLVDHHRHLATRAAARLLELTFATSTTTHQSSHDESLAILDGAILEAARTWQEHRLDDILIAAAILLRHQPPQLSAWFDQREEPAALALRRVVRIHHPLVHRNMLAWLSDHRLGSAAATALTMQHDPVTHDAVYKSAALLRDDKRRQRLRRIVRPSECLPKLADADQLSLRSQRALPVLINALGFTSRMKVELLSDCLLLNDVAARWKAADALRAFRTEAAAEGLASFAFDAERVVATTATVGCMMQHTAAMSSQLLDGLARSPHRTVRTLATARIAQQSLDGLIRHIAAMPVWAVRAALKRHYAHDPLAVRDHFRNGITHGSSAMRVHLITLARRLGLLSDLELELVMQSASNDVRVASSAVAALGYLESRTSHDALVAALRSGNTRIQANAVEAIARQDECKAMTILEPLFNSRTARVRANAIVAFVKYGEGGDLASRGIIELKKMLHDEDSSHVASACWSAEHLDRHDLVRFIERPQADQQSSAPDLADFVQHGNEVEDAMTDDETIQQDVDLPSSRRGPIVEVMNE